MWQRAQSPLRSHMDLFHVWRWLLQVCRRSSDGLGSEVARRWCRSAMSSKLGYSVSETLRVRSWLTYFQIRTRKLDMVFRMIGNGGGEVELRRSSDSPWEWPRQLRASQLRSMQPRNDTPATCLNSIHKWPACISIPWLDD